MRLNYETTWTMAKTATQAVCILFAFTKVNTSEKMVFEGNLKGTRRASMY